LLRGQVVSPSLSNQVPATDSLPARDSISRLRGVVAFSADTLEDLVYYSARDSIIFNNAEHMIYLYGEASIKYQTYSITADYIQVNLDSSIALAEQLPDSLKRIDPLDQLRREPEPVETSEPTPLTQEQLDSIYLDSLNGISARDQLAQVQVADQPKKERNEDGRPYFDDGSTQFTAHRLRYNFKTRKGKVYDVITEESNMLIHGNETKFVSGGPDTASTDYVYSQDVILTTCNADHPHYGIRSKKQKIIPNRQVIVGPSNLEIAGVPTPFILPFGFFPISRGAKNGMIFPSDYEYSDQWGFGLRDVGYYFPISDHLDLELLSDIYFNGSWGIKARSQYRKRYKYNGNINIGFSNRIGERVTPEGILVNDPQKSFSINWSHSQDPRARPNQTFTASVNMQTSGYEQLNYNDAERVLNSSYSSNVAFRKKFAGSPFALSANVRHSQNTRTNEMQFTLPDVNITMNRIFPFKSNKRRSPEPHWYEKISLQYTGKVLNRIKTQDTLLFNQPLFSNAEFGVDHDLNSSASFNLLQYFNITPSVSYNESWYFNTIRKTFDPNIEIVYDTVYNPDSTDFAIVPVDTTSFGKVLRDTVPGFAPLREYRASLSLSTTIFGSLGVGRRKGWFRGIRHVVKPTLSFNFSPDYTDPSLGYIDYVQQDIRNQEEVPYSIFEGALFGAPSMSGRQMALSYSINNLFEAKVFTRRDTTEKKIKLFNSITVNGNHNFVADSLRWSMISINGSTQFFKGLSQLNFNMAYDPYDRDPVTLRRINKFYWDTQGKLLRFERLAVRISSGLTIDQIKKLLKGEQIPQSGSRSRQTPQREEEEEESITDLFRDFRLSHDLVLMWAMDRNGQKKLEVMTNSINTRGNIRLTPNWDLSVGNIGYDFRSRRITYPYLGFTRNLHCWELGFNWAPQRGTYSFYLRVRQEPLSFIKIPYQKNYQDVQF
jgi:hypothetical protein